MFPNMRRLISYLLLLFISLVSNAKEKPNIIFIFSDDLGYADLGSYGQKLIQTPHLDRLAANGMRFTQMYSGSSLCGPSRCVLLTGKHTGQATVRHNQRAGDTLAPGELTWGSVLKQADYSTACIGKWGAGFNPPVTAPNDHGFDYFYGYTDMWHAHNSYPEFLVRNGESVPLRNEVVRLEGHHKYPLVGYASKKVDFSQELTTEEAINWMDNQEGPFCLYLPYTIPHENGEAQFEDFRIEVPDLGVYADRPWEKDERAKAALVTYLDEQVGKVVGFLEEKGLLQNTLIMFTSDNGAGTQWHDLFESNSPFRGGKRNFLEGGIRVPFIAHWPAKIESGSVSHHVGAFWDILPTLADLGGAATPADVDGISFAPTLLGHGPQAQHEYLYWELPDPRRVEQALRWNRWKLLKFTEGDLVSFELYDLLGDPGERFDVASYNGPLVAKMSSMMEQARTSYETSPYPSTPFAQP